MNATGTRQRLHYFDMLKGMAIFMVVIGHVITFCIREIDSTFLFKLVEKIHMPLFFFISGWMTWRADGRRPDMWKRALQLLVPMVAASTLWIYYFPHSGLKSPLISTFSGLWSNDWKNGYWFTLVLFEILCIYVACNPLARRCSSFWSGAGLYLLVSAVLIVVTAQAVRYYPVASQCVSLSLVTSFFPAFAAGVLAHRHSAGFARLCASSAAVTFSLIAGSVAVYLLCWPWEFSWLGVHSQWGLRPVLHVFVAIVAIAVVKPWSEEAFGPGAQQEGRPLARMWAYIGRKSLAIYLLHYFFLFPIGFLAEPLRLQGLSFVPMLVLSSVVAACIIAVVLCAERVLRPSRLLSWLLCGNVPDFSKMKTKQYKDK